MVFSSHIKPVTLSFRQPPEIVMTTLAVNPPLLAEMLIEPGISVVTKPLLSTVATAVLLDDQVSELKIAAEPSDMVPLTDSCCVLPVRTPVAGAIVNVVNTGAVTVNVAGLEVIPFSVAVIALVP